MHLHAIHRKCIYTENALTCYTQKMHLHARHRICIYMLYTENALTYYIEHAYILYANILEYLAGVLGSAGARRGGRRVSRLNP